jgi:hypothetical protein
MLVRGLVGLTLAILQLAAAHACAPTSYSAQDIAAAVAASPSASATLKDAAEVWGAAGKSESGGNLCASNGDNFGVLQISRGNLPRRITPRAYLAASLQRQVDIWADRVGNVNAQSEGYVLLAAAAAAGGSIGRVPITRGILAACVQFGPTICYNDVAALRNGQPCGGARPVNINAVWRNPASATLDGNGQTICSWGGVAIEAALESGARAGPSLALDGFARASLQAFSEAEAIRDAAAATAVAPYGEIVAPPGGFVLAAGVFSVDGVGAASAVRPTCPGLSGALDSPLCLKS